MARISQTKPKESAKNQKSKKTKIPKKTKIKRSKKKKYKSKIAKNVNDNYANKRNSSTLEKELVKDSTPNEMSNNLDALILELVCEWNSCLKKFKDNTNLFTNHIKTHLKYLDCKNESYSCLWSQCNFVSNCREHLIRHISYHEYHTILKLEGRKFASHENIPICTKDNLKANIIPESLTSMKFICQYNECLREFQTIICLIEHVKLHCSFDFESLKTPDKEKLIVQCGWSNCDRKFSNRYCLRQHTKCHTNEKIISCFQCGTFFATKTKFIDHCQSPKAEKNQQCQCNQCYKYFANKRLLRCHYNTHYNFFKCTMCDMTCPTKSNLTMHIRHRHLDAKPFECNQCSKAFILVSDLKRHIDSVHGNKTYECTELGCNFSNKTLRNLKRHVAEVHKNNAIIYACQECDKVYKRGDILSRHLKQIHKFQLPSGHKRFFYRQDENGIYRFQGTRIETLEVISNQRSHEPVSIYEVSEISQNNTETRNDSVIKVEAYNFIQIFNIKSA